MQGRYDESTMLNSVKEARYVVHCTISLLDNAMLLCYCGEGGAFALFDKTTTKVAARRVTPAARRPYESARHQIRWRNRSGFASQF